jgi:hypothetical protein
LFYQVWISCPHGITKLKLIYVLLLHNWHFSVSWVHYVTYNSWWHSKDKCLNYTSESKLSTGDTLHCGFFLDMITAALIKVKPD